jgi:phosphonate transport system permease protein
MRVKFPATSFRPPPPVPPRKPPSSAPHSTSQPRPSARRRWLRWSVLISVVLAIIWSIQGTGIGVGSLIAGREGAIRLVTGLIPPDTSGPLLMSVLTATLETLQISIAALFLGALIGLPLAALIAGNVQAPRWCASAARLTAAFLRGIPELLWALLFVAAVGLGPAAGVYAVALHAAGLLAKLCSEQMEAVDPAPVEAIRLTGASRLATTFLAILPQARSGIVSLLLYQWECNIRSSAVIGFVGAGGIGQALGISLRLFRYEELATLLVAVLVLIMGVDRISRILRRRLGAAAR